MEFRNLDSNHIVCVHMVCNPEFEDCIDIDELW